jgi:hypothetical protein
MSWQVVHDNEIAATEGWCEALLDVRQENGAVHRAIDHEWGNDPVVAQAGDEGDCFPMSVGDRCDQSLTARTAASNPYHVCAGGGLVNKHQPGGVKHALLSYPTSTGASDVGSLLLGRVQTFF